MLRMHDLQKGEFWFPAKRNGMGWDLPCRWQGWLFLLLWLGCGITALVALAGSGMLAFAGLLLPVMILSLVVVVAIKGESLR